jgi:aspartate oxidase
VCVIRGFPSAFENTHWEKEPCDHFKAADVAPRAEVAREILKEVRQAVLSLVIANAMGENFDLEKRFAEIEKKYTEAEPPKGDAS